KALLLDGADGYTVNNEGCSRLVVMRRNAENIHFNIACRVIRSLHARLWPIQKVPAVRHAWPAKRMAATRRSTEWSAAENPVFPQGPSPTASRFSKGD